MRNYAAHILREDSEDCLSKVIKIQTIKEHSEEVAYRAGEFAKCFNGNEFATICGLSHDIGKYSDGFQKRIWEGAPKVDHSSAGAQELMKLKNMSGLICAYCVAGHHSGLMDYRELYHRLNKKLVNKLDYGSYQRDIVIPTVPRWKGELGKNPGFSIFFFTRMLFSCLVDADYLDTELFMKGVVSRNIPFDNMSILKARIDGYIYENGYLSGKNGINRLRSEILERCIERGKSFDKGIYTLTVPTGGGKTISSLAFALNHAVKHAQNRIIYVVPYCAIIDQTVEVFNRILGSGNVLAHYSEADYEEDEETSKKLATENWDMPVIVTTAVQFFESLFANKTSKCRKVHNIANSVIVFDEAQSIPRDYLDPCVCAISELTVNYNTTSVLCTATQPALDTRFSKYYPGIEIKEISDDPEKLFKAFKRVSYQFIGCMTDEKIGEELALNRQVLCIVSTRAQAKRIFELLPKEGRVHLSTLMTPEHRKRAIKVIRRRLNEGDVCRVVSTSLIEAGIDLDFPVVYRSMAGLDSLIQAGGRCNREGLRNDGVTYIFESDSKYRVPAVLKRPAEVARMVMDNANDIGELSAIKKYFLSLYEIEEDVDTSFENRGVLDKNKIIRRLDERIKQNDLLFETIAKSFRFITDDNVRVIFVPEDDESRKIAEIIKSGRVELDRKFFRKISKYCVNVYERQYKDILPSLYVVDEGLAILELLEEYDLETGLKFHFEGGEGMFF